jgi:ribose-phosphate pyrophosphokinase
MPIRSQRNRGGAADRPYVVFGFEDGNNLARDLAHACAAEYRAIAVHAFPDGESKVTVPGRARHAVICRALNNPNQTLIEVLLAASVLRKQGAKTITLAAPYMPYMRQDKAFHPGEAISQRVVGGLLAEAFDRFIAVDPHLHRVKTLNEVFGGKPSLALTAATAMAQHLALRKPQPDAIAVGPDIESRPVVRAFAQAAGIEWTAASKNRRGDRDVTLTLPARVDFRARPAVIVDDIVSSGATIMNLARMLKERGAKSVEVYVTHAMYDQQTARGLRRAGISRVFSCGGIPHPSNAVSLAPVLAEALRTW